MRPVSVFPDYLVKLVIPASRAITKPAVICRCVPLHSGGYITTRTCSLLGNEGTPQISNASFWKRGRENVFVHMFSFGENETTPQTLMGSKFSGSNAAPEILLQEKALQKISLDFWSQK